jgi:hypothetical protein
MSPLDIDLCILQTMVSFALCHREPSSAKPRERRPVFGFVAGAAAALRASRVPAGTGLP